MVMISCIALYLLTSIYTHIFHSTNLQVDLSADILQFSAPFTLLGLYLALKASDDISSVPTFGIHGAHPAAFFALLLVR